MEIEYKMTGKVINGKFVIALNKKEYQVEDLGDIYLITVIINPNA